MYEKKRGGGGEGWNGGKWWSFSARFEQTIEKVVIRARLAQRRYGKERLEWEGRRRGIGRGEVLCRQSFVVEGTWWATADMRQVSTAKVEK
jgi:hypothetical protein